jgi:hypothetical protein
MNLMMPSQVKSLLMIASQLSGYPIPANVDAPAVETVTSREMSKDVCGGELFCGVQGYFEHAEDADDHKIHIRVIVDAEVDSLNAITIHELTHWLQYVNWKNPHERSCPREYLREYQAYWTGLAYQITYEGKATPEFINMPPFERGCPLATSTVR